MGSYKRTFCVAVFALLTGAGIGAVYSSDVGYAQKTQSHLYARLDMFAQVLSLVERNYVDDVDRNAMIDGAVHGMIRSLDPHSSFMSAAEKKEFDRRTAGQFVGVGIEVGIREGQLRVIMAYVGGPAYESGIRSGDTILAVDGKDVSSMNLDDLFVALRGAPGTDVRLTVRHPDGLAIEHYALTRAVVELDIVRGQLLDGDIGYVALSSFGSDAADRVRNRIEELSRLSRHGLRGLVLDLRKNPGGFLSQGVAVANLFIPSGKIVTTRGRNGVEIRTYEAARAGYHYDLPLAVLIDSGSASASEIVAGALQDHRRAVIVGTTSFGKASIQNIFPLQDGAHLKLTIGKYYTPSGRCIQAHGIEPDVEVEDLLMQMPKRAGAPREKDLEHALKGTDAMGHDPKTGDALPSVNDLQLFTALQYLKARAFYASGDVPGA